MGDPEEYRGKEEVASWRDRDPIPRLEAALLADGVLDEQTRARVWEEATAEVAAAERFAEESPDPDPARVPGVGARMSERALSFGQATLEAMQLAMREDDRVIVLGEDIGWGGSFGQFRGLLDEFGPERVIDMPISEAIIVAASRRCRAHRAAARRLDELRRVHDGRDGRDRQPGGEARATCREAR